jgi:hypothetical protein
MRRGSVIGPAKTACLALASVAAALSASPVLLARAQLFVSHTRTAIADAIAGPQFTDAAFSLDQYHSLAGTYDGAAVDGRRITVRWATGKAYCIEGVSQGGAIEHLLGPNGQVAPGRCPYVAF